MKIIADLHIHSKYARATSPQTNLENLAKWAEIKGITVLSTGDFTHPKWFKELKNELEPAEQRLFKLKNSTNPTRFVLGSEISCIYSYNNMVRKVHVLIFAPSFGVVEKINAELGRIGNLKADGRPILGINVQELARIIFDVSKDCFVVPAHIWTPWFSMFGSKSGFDSIEECFGEYSKYIYAVETGLSSDSAMNWRLSALDNIALISNSDSHSPQKVGREANVFDCELSYNEIFDAIKSKDNKKFLYTIEFFPQKGKYHYDGHRKCNVSCSPQETEKYGGICPVCGKPLTIGVMNRVEQLADRPLNFKPKNAIPFKNLVPLKEIIGEAIGLGSATKGVEKHYKELIGIFDNELKILLHIPYSELEKTALLKIAQGILRVRNGKVFIEPGYDGVYGKVKIFSETQKTQKINQTTLF